MKTSLRARLLIVCITLVSLTVFGLSTTYYLLSKRNTRRESRQHIQIAFDIILDDLTRRFNAYTQRFTDFLKHDSSLGWASFMYAKDDRQLQSVKFFVYYLTPASEKLKGFGQISAVERLALYARDRRLLLVYQQGNPSEMIGGYVRTSANENTFLPLDNSELLSSITMKRTPIPQNVLPNGFQAAYTGEIPDSVSYKLVSENGKLVFRITAPVYHMQQLTGVLVGEIAYPQAVAEHYAALSKTEINFFADNHFSIGTLPAQTSFAPTPDTSIRSCAQLRSDKEMPLSLESVTFNKKAYYQGQCLVMNAQQPTGAITISLSKQAEQQELFHIFLTVLIVSGAMLGLAFSLSFVFSHKTIEDLQPIVHIIKTASQGDLRETVQQVADDEFGILADGLNTMISHLRSVSAQVRTSSHDVGVSADAVLSHIEALSYQMEQQSSSVDNTVVSVKNINDFIVMIGEHTGDMLVMSNEVFESIQETRKTQAQHLASNLERILAAMEQMNDSVKEQLEHIARLDAEVKQVESATQRIDQALRDVSLNADKSQQLARETADAALQAQVSVDASLQGMTNLKNVVASTSNIIQEVNSWSEQVSSILNIVDEVAEQTSLLALNASIISAQAGAHGRGFAVVADEIKELATRTKESTSEIGGLIRTLRHKAIEGVNNTADGLKKADQEMALAHEVKTSLNAIVDRATHSSDRSTQTARVIQEIAGSSQMISNSMHSVSSMVTDMRSHMEEQDQTTSEVLDAVESSWTMSEQVNQNSIARDKLAENIERSMRQMQQQLTSISGQTQELQQNSAQIVAAMRIIKNVTDHILQDTLGMSTGIANTLVKQSESLERIVDVFKVP